MFKLGGIVLLACTIFLPTLIAQGPPAQPPNSQSQAAPAANQHSQAPPATEAVPRDRAANETVRTTVRGCLQVGVNRITLTDSTGNTFLLKGDVAKLRESQHKVVEISGEQFPPASRESGATIPAIDVKAVRQIADKCPVHIYQRPQAKSGAGKESAPNPATAPYSGPREAPQDAQHGPPNAVVNTPGTSGAPSPGTGNQNPPAQNSQEPPR